MTNTVTREDAFEDVGRRWRARAPIAFELSHGLV